MTQKITRTDIALLTTIVLLLLFSMVQGLYKNAREVRDNTLRLHIRANSDSAPDQQLKLELRDALLARYSTVLAQSADITEATADIQEYLPEIKEFLQQNINQKGYTYSVDAQVVSMYFDTKEYSDKITMPAGEYNALQIIIGEGDGKNWWCVMYPPLCIPVATQGEAKVLEEKIIQLNQGAKFVPKFAIVELIEKLQTDFSELLKYPEK